MGGLGEGGGEDKNGEGRREKQKVAEAEEREKEGGKDGVSSEKDGVSSESPAGATMNRGSPVCIRMQKDHVKDVQVQCIMKTPKSASMH